MDCTSQWKNKTEKINNEKAKTKETTILKQNETTHIKKTKKQKDKTKKKNSLFLVNWLSQNVNW